MNKKIRPETRKIHLEEFIDEIYCDHKQNADVKYLFFLGAGCSESSGIPLASELAIKWYKELKKQETKYQKFNKKYILKGSTEKNEKKVKSLYSEVFETLFHDPAGRQKEIQKITSDKLPALGYYTLAKLMQLGAFNSVITTNFDDLIQDALIYNGEKRAKVITHEELAFFIERSETPLVCKIHGDAHFKPHNSVNDTKELSEQLSNKLETLFHNVRLIFIGYSGNDKSILNFLTSCTNISQVYWLNRSEPTEVEVQEWWNALTHKVFVDEFDFDKIMSKIKGKFNLAAPNFEEFTSKLKKSYDKSLAEETQELENKDNKNDTDYLLLGANLFYKKQYDKAIEAYKKTIELNPENDIAYCNLGVAYGNLKEYDKEIAIYEKAIELNPENDTAYSNLGVAYAKLTKYDKAIEAYQKAIELNPKNDIAYSNLGVAYEILEEYDKAIETYQKAIKFNPENDTAYYNLGIAYAKLKKYDKAIVAYQNTIKLNPEDDGAYYNLGVAYAKLTKYDKAIETYQKAIELNPEHDKAYYNLFELYLIGNIDIDGQFETKYKELFIDTQTYINYEMLKILENIVKLQAYDLEAWKEKYKDINLDNWSFKELDEWANKQNAKVKKELQVALKEFKKHLKQ